MVLASANKSQIRFCNCGVSKPLGGRVSDHSGRELAVVLIGAGKTFVETIARTVDCCCPVLSDLLLNMPSETEERSFVQISAQMEAIIDRRPPHWESLLLQAALRSTADGINSAYVKAGRGEDAYAFF